MSKVYVIQEQLRRDPQTGVLQPAFDLTPAAEYGELEFLLPSGQISLSTAPMIQALRRGLFNFTDNDYLLLTGDPAAIFAAGAIAAQSNGGRVNALKWDRRQQSYLVLKLKL